MIKGEYKRLDQLSGYNVCGEHKTPVVVAWNGGEESYVLRCGRGHFPDWLSRTPSLTEESRQLYEKDTFLDTEATKDQGLTTRPGSLQQLAGSHKKDSRQEDITMDNDKQPTAIAFPGVKAVDLGTGELLLPEAVRALIAFASKYGLDPVRDHVVLMYSKPYITIDGYLYHAKKQGTSFKLGSRPLTADERSTYMIPEGAHAWVSELILLDKKQSFIGQGIVTDEEMKEISKHKPGQLRSPIVAKHPWLMAQKRAEWQALRRGFPIGESPDEKEG